MDRPTTLERAYQLARSGQFRTTSQIKQQLKRERVADVDASLYGRTVAQDLSRLCREAQAANPEGAPAST